MPNSPAKSTSTPPSLRAGLGYVPTGLVDAENGGGLRVTGGDNPTISLAPIGAGMALVNPAASDDVPFGVPFGFANLIDVDSLSGAAGQYLRVNSDENRIQYTKEIKLPAFEVDNLPAPDLGLMALVTDAVDDVITGLGLAPTGGGTNVVPVFGTGLGWLQL